MMKQAIDIFSELGERLRGFGEDAVSSRVIEAACRENGWFTPSEIVRAVETLRVQMLDRACLAKWLEHYPAAVSTPRNVLVVMAGNIPLVGFFDMICVVCAGHRCLVKPSAKDSVLIAHVIGLLREIEPQVALEYYDGHQCVDAVIATGSDNANRYFRSVYGDMPSLLRGSRQSVAVLSGKESAEDFCGLADDIWAYSGLGCRNVSMVFVPQGYELRLEVGVVNDKYIDNYRQQKALMTMRGERFVDLGCALLVERQEFPAALSVISYRQYANLGEVASWLEAHDDEFQCVVSRCVEHNRRVGFGCAQSPLLTDYADDKDVMAFLHKI